MAVPTNNVYSTSTGHEPCKRTSAGAAAKAQDWTGVESQPLSSMLHRGGDMAMQGLTFRTPSAALWLDLHQTKRAMDDPYDVLRPLMLDSMASRPNFDLGLAADTSRETGQGHGVQGRSA